MWATLVELVDSTARRQATVFDNGVAQRRADHALRYRWRPAEGGAGRRASRRKLG
ncbi:hypothetical protein [Candidatus Mycobacterium methanotrophicum]|uniref:hypothetical protein n=1 Tax=Candidatus Mycobacterium methanotrophicum TaxID=2943498 RepID=UPI001C595ED4|nr:hypothetical protein [Candidatus Mycobacterium methanotrophicum]